MITPVEKDQTNLRVTQPKLRKQRTSKIKEGVELSDELRRAVYSNDEELLEDVLDQDPELSKFQVYSEKKVQIIHIASQQCDNINIIRILLDKGADIDSVDANLWTPLMMASMNSNYEVANYLVSQGSNMQLESKDGNFINVLI
jgi:ankyrin repeat protein